MQTHDCSALTRFSAVARALQECIFREVDPLLQSLVDGFNVAILAYGQTGSGKVMRAPRCSFTPHCVHAYVRGHGCDTRLHPDVAQTFTMQGSAEDAGINVRAMRRLSTLIAARRFVSRRVSSSLLCGGSGAVGA